VKFWKDNKIDAEFDADPAEVARWFWVSREGEMAFRGDMPLDRCLRLFLTDPAQFGAVWDEPDYAGLFGVVLATWPGEYPDGRCGHCGLALAPGSLRSCETSPDRLCHPGSAR
jgi:hypothetical protein